MSTVNPPHLGRGVSSPSHCHLACLRLPATSEGAWKKISWFLPSSLTVAWWPSDSHQYFQFCFAFFYAKCPKLLAVLKSFLSPRWTSWTSPVLCFWGYGFWLIVLLRKSLIHIVLVQPSQVDVTKVFINVNSHCTSLIVSLKIRKEKKKQNQKSRDK